MSNNYEWGLADGALYEIRTREKAIEELLPEDEEITKPYVLGLWNSNGDGLALQGTRREIVEYLSLAIAHVKRETDPRLELDQAIKRVKAVRAERNSVMETEGDTGYALAEIRRLDEEEVGLLCELADIAEDVNEDLFSI